jgi:glycosyltransferase involved in cell wall biosynthesis
VFSRPSPWVDAVDVSFQLSTWCRWLYAHRAGAGAPSAVVGNPVRVAGFRRASDAAIARFRAAHGIDGADVVIGRIGQADDSKWSRLLVRALEYLRGRGLDARLVVVNAPPSILARCRASAHAAAVVSIDQVIGDEALSEVYSAIDLFVHVADGGESFGLVLAESMLCETPPVTLSTPWKDNSQGEVVEHGIGGLVATRPAGFLAAMESLARDRERRRDLGRRGRERILERFESSRLAREALAHAADAGLRRSPPPDRAALVELYRNAGDRPSWLTCFLIGRAMRLELTRYTTGYQPWSRFFMHCLAFLGRRCGLVKRHHG